MTNALKNFQKLAYTNGDIGAAYHMPDEKKCKKCGKTKGFTSYRINEECGDYLHSWCKRCERLYHRNYYDKVTKLKAVG